MLFIFNSLPISHNSCLRVILTNSSLGHNVALDSVQRLFGPPSTFQRFEAREHRAVLLGRQLRSKVDLNLGKDDEAIWALLHVTGIKARVTPAQLHLGPSP